ncbi:16S rRNA (guanine(527)-N(7))-methyltransferase RsmG [Henriciella marina]|uniref:16S rRNA (guanine(527)-N(7))-methyltransferase RsmG n=1 Tax=Henriciella marina TaxID=453851 RepID=UPI000371B4DC|nr:16S rRNA (guanine(527)-N(7))-methyltransferase RsmG [Henriciella marina]
MQSHLEKSLLETGVSRETLPKLEGFVELLDERRQKMNLIGPREMDQIWDRHILDSAQIVGLTTPDCRIVDLGSGAGLPGLVLACEASTRGGEVIMVESTGKKCAFLQTVITELKLPAKVIQGRIENAVPEHVDFITARALAPLPRLVSYAYPWMAKGATALFFKGERWQEELTDASDCWTLRHEAIPSRTSDTGVILKIEEAHRV